MNHPDNQRANRTDEVSVAAFVEDVDLTGVVFSAASCADASPVVHDNLKAALRRKKDMADMEEDFQSAYWAEVERHLAKPASGEQFLRAMREFFANRPNPQAQSRNFSRGAAEKTPTAAKSPLSAAFPETAAASFTETRPDMSRPAPKAAGQSSAALTKELRALRYRYIVGKLAGEDLLDSRGGLIVKKHAPITEAVVDACDQEGLLARLIVNMTLPGMEEEFT
ncbi:MAG TPA: hypothetical protein VF260_01000 [Bacilli bacterium]